MLKKIGLPLMALAGVLALAPHQAKAAVRFGVYVGAPAYTYRAYPVYPPAPNYVYPDPAYVYPVPPYVAPYRAWDRWEDRREDRREHRREEWREHRDHDSYRRDWR